MRVLALFLWVSVPLSLWLVVLLLGTPHVLWSYRYAGQTAYGTAPRYHIDCTYVGWTGARTAPAEQARCPWIRFFKQRAV